MLACYLGKSHDRQLEDLAARALARSLRLALPADEPASIIFNVRVYKLQLDALLLSPRAITVIDWKDTLGRITGDETNTWTRPDGPVLAGTFTNPYQQLLAARQTVSSYLEKESAAIFEDGGKRFTRKEYNQVGAALVFTPAKPELELNLPTRSRTWLLITGLDIAAAELAGLHSQLNLRPAEITSLVERKLACPRWEALEAVLPDQIVGRLWQVADDGTRRGWPITRALRIGRDTSCDLRLPTDSEGISRLHAEVLVAGDHAVLFDLGSKNGTYLDNARLAPGQPYVLRPGHHIVLGNGPDAVQLYYSSSDDSDGHTIGPTRTQTIF